MEYKECIHPEVERATTSSELNYKSHDLYTLKDRNYNTQFASLYFNRLKHLRPRLSHTAQLKWEKELINDKPVVKRERVLDTAPNEISWIMGTVFMEMKYKPDILEEVSKELNVDISGVKSYVDDDLDMCFLEDESGRIMLEGELLKETVLCTGVVIGVLGMQYKPGCFKVVDIVYPLKSPQKPTRAAHGKIAVVSGLSFNGVWNHQHDLLHDFLTGELCDTKEITQLIILGDSVNVLQEDQMESKNKYAAKHRSNYSPQAVQQLDAFISSMLTSIPVFIMPGEKDPAELALPQQPLHPSFFSNSSQSSHFRRLTNPQWVQIEQLRILATSGQNVNDIAKYIVPDDLKTSRLPILESCIHWQNIAPTAPDTLPAYPFLKDPFALMETPHVFLVGNQPEFESKMMEFEKGRCKVVAVPKFASSGGIVVMDLDTLDTELISII